MSVGSFKDWIEGRARVRSKGVLREADMPAIKLLFQSGQTYRQIARAYKVSGEWVRQAILGMGVDPMEGGVAVKSRFRQEGLRRAQQERIAARAARMGMTVEEYSAAGAHTRALYAAHRRHAKRCGHPAIPFAQFIEGYRYARGPRDSEMPQAVKR